MRKERKLIMRIEDICTPAILLDLDAMEHNLEKYGTLAKKHNKQIWPMVKTHKSTELAKLQKDYGCTGYLCGTLDEAEALCKAGFSPLMYAYPVATKKSIERVCTLSRNCEFYIRIDCEDAAAIINEIAGEIGAKINYTIIVDSGLHRFGVAPQEAANFADAMKKYENLILKGISTHPGHVYAAKTAADIAAYVKDESEAIATALSALRKSGYEPEIISSGSTPTFAGNIADENINIYHPGNYIFNDTIQMSTQTASEQECALSIYASVISHPTEELFICDAGAKCLGLDQGAHGNDSIKGFGTIKGHPELVIYSLSEEVGKIHVEGTTDLKVGDKIQIIPNHSCSSANLTDSFIGMRGEQAERLIVVDIRGNKGTCNQI